MPVISVWDTLKSESQKYPWGSPHRPTQLLSKRPDRIWGQHELVIKSGHLPQGSFVYVPGEKLCAATCMMQDPGQAAFT